MCPVHHRFDRLRNPDVMFDYEPYSNQKEIVIDGLIREYVNCQRAETDFQLRA